MSTTRSRFADDSPDARAALQLALTPDVGPLLRSRLLADWGDAASVLAASETQLQQTLGIGPKIARRIVESAKWVDLDAVLAEVRAAGLCVLLPESEDYPPLLREIPDPPGVLFVRGQLLPTDRLAVAVVGTRRASRYGLEQAERLAAALARAGVTVVSGLARGIDGAAHRGALAAGGRTVAVLGSGVLNIYPPEHASLADEVAQQGAIVSEALPHGAPLAGAFPQRNRIISGMTMGTLVIEAADRSGALITARLAMEQGREVFALPGRVDSATSSGPHRLLRDGAKLTVHVDDILEELHALAHVALGRAVHSDLRRENSIAEQTLTDEQRCVYAAIGDDSRIDDVAQTCGLPIQRVLAAVTALESRRLVAKCSGSRVGRRRDALEVS
ncbi:MAG: DNA-processing protein DprA [Planctomycetales bacterium]|nr:DNA-processing protein DprA [Planctomycetales bacterium]